MSQNKDQMALIQTLLQRQTSQPSLNGRRANTNILKRSHGSATEQAIHRISVILNRATKSVFVKLRTNEIKFVLATLEGMLSNAHSMPLLIDELNEWTNIDRTDRAWGVNGARLIRKLQKFSMAEATVLFEIGDRYIAASNYKEHSAFVDQLEVDIENARRRI